MGTDQRILLGCGICLLADKIKRDMTIDDITIIYPSYCEKYAYLILTKTVRIISDRKVGDAMQGMYQETMSHLRGITTASFGCMISEEYDSVDREDFMKKLPKKVLSIIKDTDVVVDWLISYAY